MLKLMLRDIHLGAKAKDKTEAIQTIAAALVTAGYVESGYADGMLNREKQASTYLGNGIAIPHGTPDSRHWVKQTGIQVFQFPEGVVWGDEGQLAYVAIGIAANSDEHLTLLRQLTHALGEEGIEAKLAAVTSAEELHAILQNEGDQSELLVNETLISLAVNSDNLLTLQALNAGNLQKVGAVDVNFMAEAMNDTPVHLGQGVWLSDSRYGNVRNAVAISRPAKPIELPGKSHNVNVLLTVSAANDGIQPALNKLTHLLQQSTTEQLMTGDIQTLKMLFSDGEATSSPDEQGVSAEFVVINPHGLHTRPGSLLVKVIKEFQSTVTVTNLDGTGKPVNALSLMKVVALGAKKGHRLRFTATGDDASLVLAAVGKAMAEGLGEGNQ